jgi:hypothetical protein
MVATVQMAWAPFNHQINFSGIYNSNCDEFLFRDDASFRGDPDPAKVADYQGVVGVWLNQRFWEVFTADSDCGSPRYSALQVQNRKKLMFLQGFRSGMR